MNDLRWALLIVGGIILLLIYIWTVWIKGHKKRVPPVWDADDGDDFYQGEPNTESVVEELTGIGQLVAEDCPRRSEGRSEDCPNQNDDQDGDEDLEPLVANYVDGSAMSGNAGPDKAGLGKAGLGKAGLGKAELGKAGNKVPDKPPIDMPEEVFVVYIVAPLSTSFEGSDILRVLQKSKLEFGTKQIFHRLSGGGETVFGVADMLEPGVLIPDDLVEHSTPGLTMFLQLPGPTDSLDACEDFMHTARSIANELGGELRDQRRSVLTQQAIEHMRERVMEHRRKEELARRKQQPR